jgi:STE24 endopeptidase
MYGFGRNKRIVLFDTLVEGCSEEQIVAVLAHELGE